MLTPKAIITSSRNHQNKSTRRGWQINWWLLLTASETRTMSTRWKDNRGLASSFSCIGKQIGTLQNRDHAITSLRPGARWFRFSETDPLNCIPALRVLD
jgi:hypothetical protein